MRIYQTKRKETVEEIAASFGVEASALTEANPALDGESVEAGARLVIPAPRRIHRGEYGENADTVCRRFGVSRRALARMNPQLCMRNYIRRGEKIVVSENCECRSSLLLNGFAGTTTPAREILHVLPYLTFLSVLGGETDGDRLRLPHGRMLARAAREWDAVPLITLTPRGCPCPIRARDIKALREDYDGVVIDLTAQNACTAPRTLAALAPSFRNAGLVVYALMPISFLLESTDTFSEYKGQTDGLIPLLASDKPLCEQLEDAGDSYRPRQCRLMLPALPAVQEKSRPGNGRGFFRHRTCGGDSEQLYTCMERFAHSGFGGMSIFIGQVSPAVYPMLRGIFCLSEGCRKVPPRCGE